MRGGALRFDVTDQFAALGGNLRGTADCTLAINRACALAQAYAEGNPGAGAEVVFPAGTMSILDPASGRNSLFGFAGVSGIRLVSNGCKLVISRNAAPYTGSALMFAFTDVDDIFIDGFDVSGPRVDSAQAVPGFRGWVFATFFGACTRITAPRNRIRNVIAPFIVHPETGTGRTRTIRIGTLEVDNAIYGFNAQTNGDDVEIENLVAHDCYRDYFIYGVRDYWLTVRSRDCKGRNLVNVGGLGAYEGCENVRIVYVDRGTIDSADGNIKLAVMLADTKARFTNCHFHLDVEYIMPPHAALASAGPGRVDGGSHSYRVTFVADGIETKPTEPSAPVTVADGRADGKVRVTNIATGEGIPNVTARRLYRTAAGDSEFKLVATIRDATTTSYLDDRADASLGGTAPAGQIHTGGAAFLLDKQANGAGTLNGHDQQDRGHELHGFTFSGRIVGLPTYRDLYVMSAYPDTRWGTGDSFRRWSFRDLTIRSGVVDFQMDPLKDTCSLENVSSNNVIRLRRKDSPLTTLAGTIEATNCDFPNLRAHSAGPPEAYPVIAR